MIWLVRDSANRVLAIWNNETAASRQVVDLQRVYGLGPGFRVDAVEADQEYEHLKVHSNYQTETEG